MLESINRVIWGIPVLGLILSVGVLYSIRTQFIQIRLFPRACKEFFRSFQRNEEGISGYRALCTALAATVGTGNIVGVAGAIAIGGPGVVFWMWICAILGMVVKFAEVSLAMIFRERNAHGEWVGGTMYIIKNAMSSKFHFLSFLYAFFGVVASFGIGNAVQMNAVMSGFQMFAASLGKPIGAGGTLFLSSLIGILVIRIFRRGADGVGNWAEKLVPPASVIYILLAILCLFLRARCIPEVINQIIIGAFSPTTATCGIVTSAYITLRIGASRGVFTNEAGMGTAAIAHSSAIGVKPVQQGYMGIMEVFLDTIVMCTLTAFVILSSGVQIPYGTDPGVQLTLAAFTDALGTWSSYVIIFLICIFAFATVLGWGLYGMRCMQYLFGSNVKNLFIMFQFLAVIAGGIVKTSNVWQFSELVNGLMAIPNLIALFFLLPVFLKQTESYRLSVKKR